MSMLRVVIFNVDGTLADDSRNGLKAAIVPRGPLAR
jgi:phosphoglycolate phosphatase-like HAD superfamily hydrolase